MVGMHVKVRSFLVCTLCTLLVFHCVAGRTPSHFLCVCLQRPEQDALSAAPVPNVITRAMVAKHPQFASEFQHAKHLGGYADEDEVGGVRDNGRFRNHLGVWDIASRDNPVLLQSFVDPEGHTGILDTSLESALDWDAAQCMEYN